MDRKLFLKTLAPLLAAAPLTAVAMKLNTLNKIDHRGWYD
jgi:hypothetical protein